MLQIEKDAEAWNQCSREIFDGLSELDCQTLAHLYKRAVDNISAYSEDAASAFADAAVIGHCVRELVNNIPKAFGSEEEYRTTKGGEEREAIGALRDVLLRESDSVFTYSEDVSYVPLPVEVANRMRDFRRIAAEGSATRRENASIAVLGYVSDCHPSLLPWIDAADYFMSITHVGANCTVPPSRTCMIEKLSIIEGALSVRLGHFFDAKRDMQAVLQTANKIVDGHYGKPTQEEVRHALSLLGNASLRFAFFSELENPEWLSVMGHCGAFKVGFRATRKNRHDAWPEAIYLERIASERPAEVVEILCAMCEMESPEVRLSAVRIACALDLAYCATIAELACDWIESGFYINQYFWTREEFAILAKRLLEAKKPHMKVGKRLLECLFAPRCSDATFAKAIATVPIRHYDKMLESCLQPLPLSIRRGVLSGFSKKLTEDSDDAGATYRVPSVENAAQLRGQSIENSVAFQLVQALEKSLHQDASSTTRWLKNKDDPFIKRCEMHALTMFLESAYEADPRSIDPDVSAHALGILMTPSYIESTLYDAELYPLFHVATKWGLAVEDDIVTLVERSCPSVQRKFEEQYAEGSWWHKESTEVCARRWMHRVLRLAGVEGASSRCRTLLEKLNEEFPNARYAAAHVLESETLTGPNSPISMEELEGMEPTALVKRLKSWQPSPEDRFKLVSHEGMGRLLAEAVGKNPSMLTGLADEVLGLRPVYRRSIVEGWAEAVKKGTVIPLSQALKFIEDAAQASESEVIPVEGTIYDDDGDYLAYRRAAGRLIECVIDCETMELSSCEIEELLSSVLKLACSLEPDHEYEERYGGDNMDPLTLSLNTVRPIALRALIKWIVRFPDHDGVDEAFSAISLHLPDATDSLADVAAIGEGLPGLMRVAPEWARENRFSLLGEESANEGQQVMLTTVLEMSSPERNRLKYLRPALEHALSDGPERYVMGFGLFNRDGMSSIGRWLYCGYAEGWVDKTDPILAKWHEVADDEHLGSAIAGLCGLLRNSEGVAPEIVERISRLWDYHAEQLVSRKGGKVVRGITALIESGYYDAAWWAPRLVVELKVNPHEILLSDRDNVLEKLSEFDSELAIEALELIARCDPYPAGYVYQDIGMRLLVAAKFNNGGRLSKTAKRCMDYLGAIGCFDLDEKVGDFDG